MQRKASELNIAKKRARQCLLILGRSRHPNQFRKSSALGCRRAHCLLCHFEKIFQRPTHKDLQAEDSMRAEFKDACI